MKLGTLIEQVKKMIKKVIKTGGHCTRFDVKMMTNTAIWEHVQKPRAAKARQKGEIFSMMLVASHRI